MKSRNMLDSFNYAIQGIIAGVKRERNVKIHLIASLLVIFLSYIFKITAVEFAIILCVSALVITAELINTSIEAVIDMICGDEYHPVAKLAKDVAAGAVLVASIAAAIIGVLIFYDELHQLFMMKDDLLEIVPVEWTIISLAVVLILTIVFKVKRSGTANIISGGFPSGHSAVSFAAATIVMFLTGNTLIIILGYFLAFLVAQSRYEGKIHSFYEVLVGSIMGILVVIIMYQLLM